MVLKARPIIQQEKGAISAESGIHVGNNVWIGLNAAAAPTNGTSGDGAGWAGPGSEYTDRTASTGVKYINTNTLASPTWTKVGTQS